MKIKILLAILLTAVITFVLTKKFSSSKGISLVDGAIADYNTTYDDDSIVLYKPLALGIVGEYDDSKDFKRLSKNDSIHVSNKVWQLAQNSSGVQIHFSSNSSSVFVKYRLKKYNISENMNNIAQNGLDLYLMVDGKWRYVNSCIPNNINNYNQVAKNLHKEDKQFILNLPLYNNVESIEIGIENGATIEFNNHFNKKIVIYGTSITQGASASRPGLNYSNILSRKLNTEFINLGFSGNGLFEIAIADIINKIDCEIIILDCTPNSNPEIITKNVPLFISRIREKQPEVPIILLESIIRENSRNNLGSEDEFGSYLFILKQNEALRSVYNQLSDAFRNNIIYIPADKLLDLEIEGTVDGTHLNDIGMKRLSDVIYEAIKEANFNKNEAL